MNNQMLHNEYPDQNCPDCGKRREIIYYKDLPTHIKNELPSNIGDLEVFYDCKKCNTIDAPWSEEDQQIDDYLYSVGAICKKCEMTKEIVDVEKVHEPLKTEFKRIIKETGLILFYCKECNEYSFISKPQAFGL